VTNYSVVFVLDEGAGPQTVRVAKELSETGRRAPAALAMDEAIELAIEGRSPYPENATFIDAEAAWAATGGRVGDR
jgi:hypothetical protein